jgi:hypothetical protein
MKIIKNAKDARCVTCFFGSSAVLVDGVAVCNRCGSSDLIDANDLTDAKSYQKFEPIFIDDPAASFQASPYTPLLPERRKSNRMWPKAKERRSKLLLTGVQP